MRSIDQPFMQTPFYMSFPKGHRAKLYSTNLIERLNVEIKRRPDLVGIFTRD